MKLKRNGIILLAVAFGLLVAAAAVRADDPLQATITPDSIGIGSFYDGSSVSVTGEIPADCEAVVRVVGQKSDLHLKKKGKAMGLLWMNMETVTLEGVPNVYILYASKDLNEVLGSRGEKCTGWKLGLPSLCEGINITPASDKKALFEEFLKLKEEEGLYSVKSGVQYSKPIGERKTFKVKVAIPSRLPAGQYTVEAVALRDGEIISTRTQPLTVKLEGFPGLMGVLAFNHSLLYGILATLIALVAGALTGFLFGGGKGAH